MKRSAINRVIAEAQEFLAAHQMRLPPFAHWSPEEMQARRAEIGEILDGQLGWDVTDYGSDDFASVGLTLFTVRNGRVADLAAGGGGVYAEKLLISGEGQVAPMHRHHRKVEDIINRGGATLALELYPSTPDGGIDRAQGVRVMTDGIWRELGPGELLRLAPGESVTLTTDIWHAFWGEDGRALAGEVSTVNDDAADNVFEAGVPRFTEVEEDATPMRLLVSDYARWLGT
ncbi:MAG: D-lyxose/D-mannose family sugar isomerase [Pseudomonadota bacterium]